MKNSIGSVRNLIIRNLQARSKNIGMAAGRVDYLCEGLTGFDIEQAAMEVNISNCFTLSALISES